MSALVDGTDGSEKVLRVVALAEVAARTALDRLGGKHRVVVHAEHQKACAGRARDDPAGELEAGDVWQIDVDDGDIRPFAGVHRLGGGRIARFQHVHVVRLGEQRSAPGEDDWVIIYDKHFHGAAHSSLIVKLYNIAWLAV